MSKNIVLIGYRGCGKTAVASNLGKNLDLKIISTDDEIIKKVGKINDFLEKNGWKAFRDVESEVIENIDTVNIIIDCGGGVVERKKNIVELKRRGVVFWLKASVPAIVERIKNSGRPSLTDKSFVDEIEETLEKRVSLYGEAADFEIDTDDKTIDVVSKEIIKKLKENAD